MIHNLDTPLGVDQAVRGSLEIHLAQTTADWEIAHQMLDEEHFLGAGREAGDRLCQAALVDSGGARSPLKVGQLKTLRHAFEQVPDPRRRHPLTAMLTLVALEIM